MLFCQQKANNPFIALPNSEKKKGLLLCYLLKKNNHRKYRPVAWKYRFTSHKRKASSVNVRLYN